jgi:glycosyltransferase involved in cell wall biosynthesis
MDTLHLLVYGSLDAGVTDTLRIGAFVEPLAKLGVEVRSWQSFAGDVLNGGAGESGSPISNRPDVSALRAAGLVGLAWADAVLFRRWRSTHPICTECETPVTGAGELAAHARATGHNSLEPDPMIRPIVELLASHPELLGGRPIIYDTDDDVLDYPAWTGLGAAAGRERDLVLRLLGIANLVTVATPVLAERLRPHTQAPIRPIRNAVDPAWYSAPSAPAPSAPAPSAPAREDPGGVRILYHGVPVRLRDYEIARPAVDRLASEMPGVHRIWLGAAHEPRVVAAVDEALPWVDGPPAFARALVEARPEIGLAPLLDEPFNRAKSELHWVEYALAGAATIASGFPGPGPYDVIRDGVDGLLARDAADWERHLRRLAGSAELRSGIAAAARDRVEKEYAIAIRASEWADAYRSAAGEAARAND